MPYVLWETTSRNLFGNYSTRDEALSAVRDCGAAYGSAFAENLALLYADEDENLSGIAAGKDLLELSNRSSTSTSETSAEAKTA